MENIKCHGIRASKSLVETYERVRVAGYILQEIYIIYVCRYFYSSLLRSRELICVSAYTVCKLMVTRFNSAINRGHPCGGHQTITHRFLFVLYLGKLQIYLTRFNNIYRSGWYIYTHILHQTRRLNETFSHLPNHERDYIAITRVS